MLQRDFPRFRRDGLTTLSISLYWFRVETARGVYDEACLAPAKALTERAHAHGLRVLVTFHAL